MKRGFVLIELMMAIAIIGLLLVAASYGLNSARVGSRDAKRMSDLSALSKGIDGYASANGGRYTDLGTTTVLTSTLTALSSYLPQPVTSFVDPRPASCSTTVNQIKCGYLYVPQGKDGNASRRYVVAAGLESTPNTDNTLIRPLSEAGLTSTTLFSATNRLGYGIFGPFVKP